MIDFLQEIGDAHVWRQSVEPTGKKARFGIVLGFWLRRRQSIAVESQAWALTRR